MYLPILMQCVALQHTVLFSPPGAGKFEIDIVNLMNKEKPIVYRLEEGKYVIDVAESFKRSKELKQETN